MDKNSLAHTTWECKYHIVFAPRRKIIYRQIRADIGRIYTKSITCLLYTSEADDEEDRVEL